MMAMWRRLTLLGSIGAASLALVSFEQFDEAPLDPALLRLLAVLQPAVLVALCVALGLWAAPRVGFDAPAVRAWAERRPVWPALSPQLAPAALGGLAIAALLVVFWSVVRAQAFAAPVLAFELPLATKLLYGGIVEELLLRWGLMSLFVWVAWRAGGRAPGAGLGGVERPCRLVRAVRRRPSASALLPVARSPRLVRRPGAYGQLHSRYAVRLALLAARAGGGDDRPCARSSAQHPRLGAASLRKEKEKCS